MSSPEKNTPELWDNLWQNKKSPDEETFSFLKEEKTTVWQKIESTIIGEFGTFRGIEVIEIGAGMGTYSALFAKRGAQVTILDYSEEAIKRSKAFF